MAAAVAFNIRGIRFDPTSDSLMNLVRKELMVAEKRGFDL